METNALGLNFTILLDLLIHDLNILTYYKRENNPYEERHAEKKIKQNLIHYCPSNPKVIKDEQYIFGIIS